MSKLETHWNERYQNREDQELSWTEDSPDISLALIEQFAKKRDSIIDVGAGRSTLLKCLMRKGYNQLTHLELSSVASAQLQSRLGKSAHEINWVCENVLEFLSESRFDVWHDRAVFHFLNDEKDRQLYINTLEQNISTKGVVILSTFHTTGPESCSGLPVCRYTPDSLLEELNRLGEIDWKLVKGLIHEHQTPSSAIQTFQYSVFSRD